MSDTSSDAEPPTSLESSVTAAIAPTEESALLPSTDLSHSTKPPSKPTRNPAPIICVLLLGVLIAQIDGSIVIATMSTISSDFDALDLGNWLTTAYSISVCAAQPLVGKLSDVFGRKSVLLCCYTIFCIGTLSCGMGQTIGQVIAGRAIAGLGGAGMSVLVSVIITDLVPGREVAAWRSYVSVVGATGRTIGSPLGGFLADFVGWRVSFLLQVPIIVTAVLLVHFRLEDMRPRKQGGDAGGRPKWTQIDYAGAAMLSGGIVALLLAVDGAGRSTDLHSILVVGPAILALVLLSAFVYYESHFATNFIFPPRLLLQRDVATSYAINFLQTSAQLSLNFSVPLYFRVVTGASNTSAGARLLPGFIGNLIGSILAGQYIKRTGYYKVISVSSVLVACSAFILINLNWHGDVGFWKGLEIAPAGFGSGASVAASFIVLTADMEASKMATAASGYFLSGTLGSVVGITTSSSIQRASLKGMLERVLNRDDKDEIIDNVMSDVNYPRTLTGNLRNTVIDCFIRSLEWSHAYSLMCSFAAFCVALCIKEKRLN